MRTVRDSIAPYLQHRLAAGELSKLTAREHRYILQLWAEVCGDRPLERLGRRDVERLAESWDGIAPSTRRVRYAILKAWHRWAKQRYAVSSTMFDYLIVPKEPRRPPRSITSEQVAELIRQAPDSRTRALVIWSVQLGLRCCELARLDYSDLDFDNDRVRIVGKGGHERVLPIPAEARQALEEYWADVGVKRGPLFRRYDCFKPMSPRTISRNLGDLFRAAGVKRQPYDGLSAHALRHTMATDLLRSGKANLIQVKGALGHASVATTQRYLSALETEDLADVMAGRNYRSAS